MSDQVPTQAQLDEYIEQIRAQFAEALSDPRYLQMVLGLALLKLPRAQMTVSREDYASLVGKGCVVEPMPDGSYILKLRDISAADIAAVAGSLGGMTPMGNA